MSFILYDVETTGTDRSFDQILQFAAIRADSNLEQIDTFNTQCRLLPHVIPAPGALAINGLRISDITDTGRKSHYAMMTEIREALTSWCPAIFLGFNSIRFDEEFLRHGFYQCLYPPYITNTNQSARADVLALARAFAAFHPDQLTVPHNADGRPTFSLHAFAVANGFPDFAAHEAMADVRATLHICQLVAQRAPELWSRFLHFSQRAAAIEFMREEIAFLLFEPAAQSASFCVAWIGANRKPKQTHIHYCLNLQADIEMLRALSSDNLINALASDKKIVRRVRVNASPMFCPLYEAPLHLLADKPEHEWQERATSVRNDEDFLLRLLTCCEYREKTYPPSNHVEQQLYEFGFWSDTDRDLLAKFHEAPWQARAEITRELKDRRLRILARRLLYIERPDLFDEQERSTIAEIMHDRIHGKGHENPPWMTTAKARLEIHQLEQTSRSDHLSDEYIAYIARL